MTAAKGRLLGALSPQSELSPFHLHVSPLLTQGEDLGALGNNIAAFLGEAKLIVDSRLPGPQLNELLGISKFENTFSPFQVLLGSR